MTFCFILEGLPPAAVLPLWFASGVSPVCILSQTPDESLPQPRLEAPVGSSAADLLDSSRAAVRQQTWVFFTCVIRRQEGWRFALEMFCSEVRQVSPGESSDGDRKVSALGRLGP